MIQLPPIVIERDVRINTRDIELPTHRVVRHGFPSLVVDRSTTKKFVVLRRTCCRALGDRERLKETLALDGLLWNSVEHRRHIDTERIEHRWHDVDHVQVLGADLTGFVRTGRPMNNQRVGNPTLVTFTLPTLERRIASVRPPIRIVAVRFRAAQEINVRKHCIKRERNAVVPSHRIEGAVFIALRRCAVITQDNHDRVVEFTDCFQMVKHPTNVVIGMSQEAGVDLHHSGIGALLFFGKRGPFLNPLGARRELCAWRKDAEI